MAKNRSTASGEFHGKSTKGRKARSGQIHDKGAKGRILKDGRPSGSGAVPSRGDVWQRAENEGRAGTVRRETVDLSGSVGRTGPGELREKRSVTLDGSVAGGVDRHVERGAADSFSAAVNEAAARWVANQDLRQALDEMYEQDPDARPSDDEVRQAAVRLGLR